MPEKRLYVGTKIIEAYPKEQNFAPGYAVFYPPDGYEYWAPKEQFENVYRLVTAGEKKLINKGD